VRRVSGVGVRLSLALLAVVVAALGVVYVVVVPSLEGRLVGSRMSQVKRAAAALSRELPANRFDWPDFLDAAEAEAPVRVVVYDVIGPPTTLVVVGDTRGDRSTDVAGDRIALAAATRQRPASGTVVRGDARYAEAAVPHRPGTVVLVSSPLGDALGSVHLVRDRLLLAGLLGLLVALVVGYAGAQAFAHRIRRIERAAERIAGGDFDVPVLDHSTDEVGELARAFDRMRQRLAQLDHARREFIANASHELRTPLFSLSGFLELLLDEELDPATRREFLETMSEQVKRLTKMSSELLDLSRLDAGRLEVEREPVALAGVASTLVEEFSARALAAGRPLALAVADGARDATVLADEDRLLQIGRLLLENAFVHTSPETPVRVRVSVAGGEGELAVEDEGPGIPAEHLAHVFDRFYRVDGAVASGSGLGLAIARELAVLMAGTLRVESAPGRTVFRLRLPTAPRPPLTQLHVKTPPEPANA